MSYLGYFSISFEKITLYTEILTWKVELWIFSLMKKYHKTTFLVKITTSIQQNINIFFIRHIIVNLYIIFFILDTPIDKKKFWCIFFHFYSKWLVFIIVSIGQTIMRSYFIVQSTINCRAWINIYIVCFFTRRRCEQAGQLCIKY